MHRSLAIAFLGIALIVAGMVTADAGPTSGGPNIGFIDFDRILNGTPAGKRASAELEKELKTKQQELDKQQKALQQNFEQLRKQQSILKPDVLKKKQRELEKRYVELQQTYVKLERELVEKRTKLIRQILKQAEPVIKELAKKENYHVILDRSAVVWSTPTFDLTPKVMQRMK
ncbi:MAG: OmpH family outer membrane protein [Proteobacteria bacterium]|nr:OmpH family outer membrane protein [Pseudomonadota bacterium]